MAGFFIHRHAEPCYNMSMNKGIRTRIAPSPTGVLHIGTARTALINWIFARQQKGTFILRIDDTDTERSTGEFEDDIRAGLELLGLKWDEEYRQSARTALYKKYLQKLFDDGHIFFCPHESQKDAQGIPHVCSERDTSCSTGILRFKNNETDPIIFSDLIRGEVSVDPKTLGDFSVARNLEHPLFILATTIDDAELEITHVIRGEDHLSNVPKQILIGRALNFTEPIWAHMPLILGKDRSKLSKRHGATALDEYIENGYLPSALVNFFALLGWHPKDDKEIFTANELLKEFELERMQKGGAIYDDEKLAWTNKQHISAMSSEVLVHLIAPFLIKEGLLTQEPKGMDDASKNHPVTSYKNSRGEYVSEKTLIEIISVEKSRISTLEELGVSASYFFIPPTSYDAKELLWKGKQEAAEARGKLEKVHALLTEISEDAYSCEALTEPIMELANTEGRGDTLWPLRVALSGQKASAGPIEILSILGKNESLNRITHAIALLQ